VPKITPPDCFAAPVAFGPRRLREMEGPEEEIDPGEVTDEVLIARLLGVRIGTLKAVADGSSRNLPYRTW